MNLSPVPGPVRVAIGIDGGIAAVYATAAAVGVPEGALGRVLVAGEAAVWAAVVLVWVFRAFWSRWSGSFERVFTGETRTTTIPLATLPSRRSTMIGAALFLTLALVQALTSSGEHVAFRSVVAAYVVAGALGAALLAIVSDVTTLLAATRTDD